MGSRSCPMDDHGCLRINSEICTGLISCRYKRPSIYWLIGPFGISAMAHGGVMVPKVNLVLNLICHNYFKGQPTSDQVTLFDVEGRCRIPEIQSRVATFKLCMALISGILAAIVAPRIGALSDRYGRIPMLCIVNFGTIALEIITILAARFPDTVSIYWMFLGSFFEGLGGSPLAAMAISHSYAADCTPSSKRNVVFGYFHGCLFTGVAIGPILAGYLIQKSGDMISMFYISCGAHFSFLLALLFLIPESVPKRRQLLARQKHRRDNAHRAGGWKNHLRNFNVFEPLKILHGPGIPVNVRRNLILLASTDTIVFGVGMGAHTVILLYSNYTFGWGTWEQSKFASIVNTCKVCCLLFLLPTLTHWYRRRQSRRGDQSPLVAIDPDMPEGTDIFELSVIRFAIFADIFGFLGYALAPTGTAFILSGAIASIGGISSPTMQAALTKHVPKESIGQLLGAMGLLHALGRTIGPSLFTGIYAATVKVAPSAYFFVLAVMFGFGFAVSWLVKPGDFRRAAPRLD
ncbi:MFS general substrate transporter [Microthyrium microscopicum]|uniref:MFS general substrate transporter n=1 Tax=Microthyrium microscopicum TaxID=703497 RepID=A0A6A6U9D3_9PEZI|nr:MFS general substrate transporter [Microthyrium microscopicum]